jgi:tripartite-type tricarboxylate transporter receptor subunit TctC
MNILNRRQALVAAGAMGAAFAGFDAAAQARFENAKIIVGFSPGGTTDNIARRMADSLRGVYANTVVVENKTGAATRIGIEAVKNSAPDGQTMLMTPASMLYIYPHIYDKLSYDPFTDFAPVSTLANTTFGFAVGPAVPLSVVTVNDFVNWCKANPKKATYGSPAAGSTPHFMAALLARRVGVDMVHVGYRGAAPAVLDLLGGHIAAVTSGVGDFLPYLQEKRLRVIATSGEKRTRWTPSVPTFVEQGFDKFVFSEAYAVFAPARTPPDVVQRLAADIRTSLQKPEVRDALVQLGLEPGASSPAELAQLLRSQYDYWAPAVKAIGFKAE